MSSDYLKSLNEAISLKFEIFKIPKYQRTYSWKKENWSDLLSDIENTTTEKEDYHFFGTIVLAKKEDSELKDYHVYEIMDGQQRIVTISLVLLAIKKLLNNSDSKKEFKDILTEIEEMVTVKPKKRRNPSLRKLYLSKYDDAQYNAIYKDNRDNWDGRKSLGKCFSFFLTQFKDKTDEELEELAMKIIDHFNVINLETGKELDPYDLFESMNDRGLALGTLDLIRNSVLSRADKLNIEAEIKNIWDEIEEIFSSKNYPPEIFFRLHYLININSKKLEPKGRKIYRKTKDYFNKLNTKEFIEHIELLRRTLQNYKQIIDKKIINYKSTRDNGLLSKKIEEIDYLGASRINLITLFLLNNKEYYPKTIIEYLNLILNYSIRLKLTSASTAPEETLYLNILKKLEKDSTHASKRKNIKQTLIDAIKTQNLTDERVLAELEDSFKGNHKLAKYILCKIEDNRSNDLNPTFRLMIEDTLEHTYPQNPKSDWTILVNDEDKHLLGNLTILETGLNSKIGRKSFNEKMKVYRKSKHKITKEYKDYKKWDDESIKIRTTKLSTEFLKLLEL